MAELRIFYDREGNTLTVWFGEPSEEAICEETRNEIILMKNKAGEIIGFEKLNFLRQGEDTVRITLDSPIAEKPTSKVAASEETV